MQLCLEGMPSWSGSPPTAVELRELGYDPGLKFGLEFEYYSDLSRADVASALRCSTDLTVYDESWNKEDNDYWKIITDGSLNNSEEYDEDEPEYDCDTCRFYDDHECEDRDTDDGCQCSCDGDCDYWQAESYQREREGRYRRGHELVSRPLAGYEGVDELWQALHALRRHAEPEVDSTCGLHVHIDARDFRPRHFRTLMPLYMKYERTLDTVVDRRRRGSANGNCRTLLSGSPRRGGVPTKQWWKEVCAEARSTEAPNRRVGRMRDMPNRLVDPWYDRYVKLNGSAWHEHRTVEFRHHQGTVDFDEALYWMLLCQRFVITAKKGKRVILPDDLDTREPIPIAYMMKTLEAPRPLRSYWYGKQDWYVDEVERQRREEEEALRREAERRLRRQREAEIRAYEARVFESVTMSPEQRYEMEHPPRHRRQQFELPERVRQAIESERLLDEPTLFLRLPLLQGNDYTVLTEDTATTSYSPGHSRRSELSNLLYLIVDGRITANDAHHGQNYYLECGQYDQRSWDQRCAHRDLGTEEFDYYMARPGPFFASSSWSDASINYATVMQHSLNTSGATASYFIIDDVSVTVGSSSV